MKRLLEQQRKHDDEARPSLELPVPAGSSSSAGEEKTTEPCKPPPASKLFAGLIDRVEGGIGTYLGFKDEESGGDGAEPPGVAPPGVLFTP